MLLRRLISPLSRPVVAAALLILSCSAHAAAGEVPSATGSAMAPEGSPGPLEITYVGNEGVLLAAGEEKVLVDALYREGVDGYLVHSPALRESLEAAEPPFDGVDLVLATHYHADHFDAGAAAAHLQSNPGALFVSTPQAVEKLRAQPGWEKIRPRVRAIFPPEGGREALEHRGVKVTVLNLHHGRERPIQNLGFLVEMGGRKLLHAGDTQVTHDDVAPYRLHEEGIDLGLLPYWYLTSGSLRQAVEEGIRPGRLVPIHIPAADAPEGWFENGRGLEGLLAFLEKEYPRAVILRRPMETRSF